eukprot:SAG11_NODE_24711_length_369_cov_0.929630_1_plen_39_part_10
MYTYGGRYVQVRREIRTTAGTSMIPVKKVRVGGTDTCLL